MKRCIAALALMPLPLLAAGCDPNEGPGGPSSAPSVTPSSAPVVTGSSAPPGSAVPSGSQPRSAACHTGDLRVTTQGAPGGGAAGSQYDWLVFRNVSARTCTLYGYPGVSWLTGPSGQQVNDPLQREQNVTPARVVLAPQGAAHAVVQRGQPGAFEPQCHAVEVAGFRVYPPDETASVFVPLATQACSTKGINVGTVSPIVAGLSE
ncbi:DUF4232 domain-containing protein [Dactylosporangium siamense]|uniref:DUF4232 domain-containing protein n=1 Tax=Dactylosporangium siamense TaxID=685454 RepID=A0A919UF42_9ACTN|nr:DUF4232 domain-containing protein [Dactylosporangium siamense]GIG49751.1 hypothetical protein Dsi01nite_077920 [Dactylosporangium siamense]